MNKIYIGIAVLLLISIELEVLSSSEPIISPTRVTHTIRKKNTVKVTKEVPKVEDQELELASNEPVNLVTHSSEKKRTAKKTRKIFKVEDEKIASEVYFHSLNFSDEHLPASDIKVRTQMKRILAVYHYDHLQTNILHDKAKKWFPIILPILRYYNIPEDFKYLPLVESGLASGTSPKGASGNWQLMPQTARDFGLRVDATVDERQEITKSTVAACKYLKSLHKQFNNWALVAAAYNGGENRIKRRIKEENQSNYFKMTLNKETATFVYRLIAIKEIIEKPALYGYRKKANGSGNV